MSVCSELGRNWLWVCSVFTVRRCAWPFCHVIRWTVHPVDSGPLATGSHRHTLPGRALLVLIGWDSSSADGRSSREVALVKSQFTEDSQTGGRRSVNSHIGRLYNSEIAQLRIQIFSRRLGTSSEPLYLQSSCARRLPCSVEKFVKMSIWRFASFLILKTHIRL